MGNIQADVNGEAWFVKSFDLLSLDAAEGRSIIIHQVTPFLSYFSSFFAFLVCPVLSN
tara:strand:- start:534 stop:707 length:174 start_codon:yes stop_codon:yes gene_type:complete